MPFLAAFTLSIAIVSPLEGWTQVVAFAVVWSLMCLAIRHTTARVR